MTDRHTDDIRDLLARAMFDSPEPHPWADVEQRARRHDAPTPQRRRRTGIWLAAAACVVVLIAGLSAVALYDDEPNAPTDRTTPATVASTSLPATTTSAPPTSLAPVGLFELSSDTPMLWTNGVLMAAWIDEQFVPIAQTTGLPSELLGTAINLPRGSDYSSSWTPEVDECGTVRLRPLEDQEFPDFGYRWSPSYPMSESVGGRDAPDDPDLDAALNNLGLDPISVGQPYTPRSAFTYVPSEDLDGDPDVEVVILRYDMTTLIDDQRGYVWLAVWDPATGSITTLAGDPETNDVHFGFADLADVDANGLLDAAIDTGDAVTLFELSTGKILSSVTTPCPDPEG